MFGWNLDRTRPLKEWNIPLILWAPQKLPNPCARPEFAFVYPMYAHLSSLRLWPLSSDLQNRRTVPPRHEQK
jgi:hypothetical protein